MEDVKFTHCPFWIQIHGLPIEKMTRANAELMGRRFGQLLAVESSHDGILLGRSFLRVRAAIKLDDPLPKGFFLRRKPGCGNDLWISYKYEKLTDFCYACGRIGHENKICKFVSREAGERSGYGPELRTGRVRQSTIPIEEIRQQVDEAEARVNLLLQQRPIAHYGDDDARDNGDAGERVRTTQNIPRPLGMRQPRSPAYTDVLDGTGGNTTMEKGTTSSPLSSIRLGFINSDPLKSTLLSSTQIVSDPPDSFHIPNLSLGLNNSPKANPHPAHSTNTAHHYFVTEPPDSPKTLSLKPFAEPNTLTMGYNPPNSLNSPIPSPSNQKTITQIADVSLVKVFNSLTIKRKIQEDVEEPHRSKILRLCAPENNPTNQNDPPSITKSTPRKNPSPSTRTKTTHLLRRSPRKLIPLSSSIGNGLNADNIHETEDALYEINIGQEYESQGGDTRKMFIEAARDYEENEADLSKNGKGLVAGPKQPHPQC